MDEDIYRNACGDLSNEDQQGHGEGGNLRSGEIRKDDKEDPDDASEIGPGRDLPGGQGRNRQGLPTEEQGQHGTEQTQMENTRQLLLCFYEPLQLFGDLEIFEQEPMSTTTVEALTPCVCLGLKREFVINQMAMDPVFLKHLCLSLGRKLGRAIRNSALNLLHPLENRVASYILATATSNHKHQLVFSGNLTQIADLLGTSFRHLHRTLQSFCDQGILVKVKTNYTIQQIGELERRAAGVYVVT